MLNLVVLDVPDHSWPTPSRLPEELRAAFSRCHPPPAPRCKEEQLLWSKSLSPPRPSPSPHTTPLCSLYFTRSWRSLDYTHLENENRTYPVPSRRCRRRTLGSLRAPGDIRNTVAIILPFDLTSCTLRPKSTARRYGPTVAVIVALRREN